MFLKVTLQSWRHFFNIFHYHRSGAGSKIISVRHREGLPWPGAGCPPQEPLSPSKAGTLQAHAAQLPRAGASSTGQTQAPARATQPQPGAAHATQAQAARSKCHCQLQTHCYSTLEYPMVLLLICPPSTQLSASSQIIKINWILK